MKIKILSVGKTKEPWLEQALNEYLKRLQPIASVEFSWAKNDSQLIEWAEKESSLICLDINGRLMSSEQLSSFLHHHLVKHGARLTFVIGGSNGLPEPLSSHPVRISLSPLTFAHQMTRLILLEQLYRSFEILKGSQYHK